MATRLPRIAIRTGRMSQYITQIEVDSKLRGAMASFSEVCVDRAVELGLSPADLAEIDAAASGFSDDLLLLVAAKSALNSAIKRKDAQKESSQAVIAKWAKVFRANPEISNATLANLQLAHHHVKGTRTSPTIPTKLIANSDGQGNIGLKWDRGGNRNGTVFEIQSRTSVNGEWRFIASTTKVRFQLQAPVGKRIEFRVRATRASQSSAYSTPFTLWPGSDVSMKMAA